MQTLRNVKFNVLYDTIIILLTSIEVILREKRLKTKLNQHSVGSFDKYNLKLKLFPQVVAINRAVSQHVYPNSTMHCLLYITIVNKIY